ncbi:NF-kappa-B inhibitor beta isoform X2 [Chiloscyllium plagiosum]|uniref:NF-kappa-B inhibitor beta isoform X2 n=1 Tax=Chiloscyllium plagiosum TaxID=36176 RepID=UPI001CB80025|nr:NF-kappa-B inhibitor beta isoform X2 [Chiloscyllium plagiosum]
MEVAPQLLNGIASKQMSKLGTGKVAAPWGGQVKLDSMGLPAEVESDDYYDSGIGSLSELQVRQFNELGGVDQSVDGGESRDGMGQMSPGTEPDICLSTQKRSETGVGQITQGIEDVKLSGTGQITLGTELGTSQEAVDELKELRHYRTEDMDSALHLSVIHEKEDFFVTILCYIKDAEYLNLQNDLNQSALHLAVIVRRADFVERLVAAGANLLLQEKDGNTALHLACMERATSCVHVLLFHHTLGLRNSSLFDQSQVTQQLNCYNYKGLTPLHLAVKVNDVHIVEYLLQSNVDINAKERSAGRTALHLAVEEQNQQIVKLLLDWCADVHAQMYSGYTPICLAVCRPNWSITQMLRDYGSSEPDTDEESEENEEIDEDGMGEYDDFVVHGC